MQVARALGIAPGLIHYYLGDRDHLLSGVMNAFYRIVVDEWPATKNDWRHDVEAAGRHLYAKHVQYAGIATYAAAHNRFRVAELVEPAETDFGLLALRALHGHRARGRVLGAHHRDYAQLLVDFFVMSAHSTVRRRWPGEHGGFMEDVFSRLDPATYPNAAFVRREFVRVDAGTAFDSRRRASTSPTGGSASPLAPAGSRRPAPERACRHSTLVRSSSRAPRRNRPTPVSSRSR